MPSSRMTLPQPQKARKLASSSGFACPAAHAVRPLSSSASVGILQALSATGVITYGSAIPIIMGQNIGTTVTAVLASVGQSRDAKRLAAAHALFNLSGAAVCWLLLPQFTALVRLVSPHGPESAVLARQIANAHTLFNLGCTVLWLPLTPCMVRIVCILLPEKHAPELK